MTTQPAQAGGEWIALREVAHRLAAGQKFNAYETHRSGCVIGIGPVTDFLQIASATSPEAADLITDALRATVGQPPCVSRLSELPS